MLHHDVVDLTAVAIGASPSPSPGWFVWAERVCQHEVVVVGEFKESQASFICYCVAELSTCAFVVRTGIFPYLCIPVSLYYEDVLFGGLVYDFLQLFIELFYVVVVIVCCWGIGLDYGDVEGVCS